MLPGPVFAVEMVTTARRRRYYATRLLYGLILLLILGLGYGSSSWRFAARGLSPRELSAFAQSMFVAFTVTQAVAIGLLTPALVAGVIADEKQRKTLHYLLASALSGGEIVLGKLAARLLHLGVFLAIGLPVISLLTLFGGVDPVLIGLAYAGTGAGMFFVAGMSILASTYARRVRDAILVAYLVELAWLALPPLVAVALIGWRPALSPWVRPVNDWVLAAGPGALLMGGPYPTPVPVAWLMEVWAQAAGAAPSPWLARCACMVGLQLAYGAGCVGLAVWRLRPVFRSQEARRGWWPWVPRGRGQRRWRLLRRPACGDDAMLWKERYVTRTRGLARVVAALVVMALFGFGGYGLWYFGGDAFRELATYGYGASQSGARQALHGYLQFIGTILYLLTALGMASSAAGSVSGEREEDTWTSLLATPLEGEEILRAKMIGAAWGLRWFVAVLVLSWGIGVAAGSIHPFGFVTALIALAVFAWFAVALGTFVSLRARTTTRALGWTIGLLLAGNAGYLLIVIPLEPNSPVVLFGCTPAIVAFAPLSFEDVWALLGVARDSSWSVFRSNREGPAFAAACVLGVLVYAGGALALTLGAFLTFDQAVDRPRRDWSGPSAPQRERPDAETLAKMMEDEVA